MCTLPPTHAAQLRQPGSPVWSCNSPPPFPSQCAVVASYELGSPVWSCSWSRRNPHHIYAGLQDGRLVLIDMRWVWGGGAAGLDIRWVWGGGAAGLDIRWV